MIILVTIFSCLLYTCTYILGSPGGSDGKESACNTGETQDWSLGQEDPLEKGMATHSSILEWKIPCTEEPGGLPSMCSQIVGHDWVTNAFTFHIYFT